MIFHYRRFISGILAATLILSTLSVTGCGKETAIVKNKVESVDNTTETFAESFFEQSNISYEKIKLSDVQNTSDEFLFYIADGVVYRTTGDYCVVIVARKELRESPDQVESNYSGELYQVFEDDEIDLLKYCAAGDYALMALPSTIPDWEDNEMIAAFMAYASQKS